MAFTEFTAEKKEKFLKALRLEPNVTKACRRAHTSKTTAYLHRNPESTLYDPEFAEEWEEALAVGLSVLEEEMWRRAVKGTKKPVYQGGALVGHIQEYSDTLAIFLAKAHMPEKYRDRHEIVGAGGGPIVMKVIYEDDGVSDPPEEAAPEAAGVYQESGQA